MNPNRPSWRPFAGASALLIVLSVISFTVLRDQPARANHGATSFLSVSPQSLGVTTGPINQNVEFTWTATLSEAPATSTLIMMEIETGVSDPDAGASYTTPEAYCTIAATTETSCEIKYTFTIAGSHTLRFYVNNHQIDTTELPNESGTPPTGFAGCQEEPDTTDALTAPVTGTPTGTPPASTTPPPGVNVPYDCNTPEPSGSGSPTPTGSTTTTPSPTSSTTVTPSPSGSTTVTPSPSGSTTTTPSPSGSTTTTPSPSGSTTATPSPTGSGTANLTIGVTPTVGVYGTDFTVEGDLTCQGAPVSAAEIVITYQYTLDPPQQFIVATDTGTNGHYALTLPDLISSSTFIASWEGNTQCPGMSVSGQVIARVRPGVIVNPTTQTAGRNQSARFVGRIVPAHPGTKVYLMILEGSSGVYRIVGETTQDAEGDYTLTYKMSGSHFLVFRTAWPTQHKDHVWNWGRNVRVN